MVKRFKKCWGWKLQGRHAITMDEYGYPELIVFAQLNVPEKYIFRAFGQWDSTMPYIGQIVIPYEKNNTEAVEVYSQGYSKYNVTHPH